jgi:CheY-like chemotaxis protein
MPCISSRVVDPRASLVRGACRGGELRDPHQHALGGQPGRGSWPRDAARPAVDGRSGVAPDRPAPRKWILVVDDDHAVRRYLTVVLEGAGFSVVSARDGLEARDLMRDLQPHLVILDLRMPGMPGRELLQLMEEVPVLVLSGYLGDLSPQDAARRNVVGHLQKPVDPATLRTRVEAALRDATP